MIRDPSDGTVKQKSAPESTSSLPSGESDPSVTLDWAGADTTSGLPTEKLKAEELARLEASREWIIQRNRRASD